MRRLVLFLVLFYWACGPVEADARVPASLIRLPPSVSSAFIAETSTARFHRFDGQSARPIEYVGHTYMSIGENGDGKERAGDRKTPLGIYFVTGQIDTEKLHEKYGATAYPLDYPNAWDRRHRRTGDGIWVHGSDRRRGQRPPQDTDGCLALPNKVLTELADRFEPNSTPVLITRHVQWIEAGEAATLREALEASVRRWASTLEEGEVDAHLSLYGVDFRHWGMDKSEWSTLVADMIAERGIHAVEVKELLLLADPSEKDLYLSRFELAIAEADGNINMMKRLYWRRTPDGRFLIVAEDAG